MVWIEWVNKGMSLSLHVEFQTSLAQMLVRLEDVDLQIWQVYVNLVSWAFWF